MGPLTYADYEAMPDDGRRYDLIDGELILAPTPEIAHQWVVGELAGKLCQAGATFGSRGVVLTLPLDVILSETNVVQPDIVYVDATRNARGSAASSGLRRCSSKSCRASASISTASRNGTLRTPWSAALLDRRF